MSPTLNEKFLAYLALISGLTLSIVAEYYSILGLTAIFSAAFIPVVIMGVALGVGKIAATLWLKQNWNIAPWSVRVYLLTAIAVLMVITSMGIFGFLSKAHSDQSLVSGDVLAKISIYDEKINTEKENIDVARKALKQLDEAVDQVMVRSSDERGADKASQIRRAQQRERTQLQRDINNSQSNISKLQAERAPIAAEVRKVEAEVGPIKYIATFVYGQTDPTILEKAVTWVIIILIVVFDPLAVILLLSSQISFQNFRERIKESYGEWTEREFEELAEETFKEAETTSTGFIAQEVASVIPEAVTTSTVDYKVLEDADEEEPSLLAQHPYLTKGDFWKKPEGWVEVGPLVAPYLEAPEAPKEYLVDAELIDALEGTVTRLQQENDELKEKIKSVENSKMSNEQKEEIQSVYIENARLKQQLDSLYVQNEEQTSSGLWNKLNSKITEEEYIEQSKQKKDDNSNNAS
jgi:hypothetical protein